MSGIKDIMVRMKGTHMCYALNIHVRSGEQWDTSLFLLKKVKEEIRIEKKDPDKENLNSKLLIITIFGKQCLIRNKKSEDQSADDLIPGISKEDFFLDESPNQLALIRKNTYDAIVSDLGIGNSVQVGTFLLPRQKALVNFKSEGSIWGNLCINANELTPAQETDTWYDNDGKSYTSHEIPAVAEAFDFLLSYGKTPAHLSDKEKSTFQLFKAFHIGWKAATAVLLIGLSINFYLFDSYSQQYDNTRHQIQQNESWVQEAERLKAEYESRKDFIESRGLNKRTINAYIIDQVCAPLQKGIRLEKVITKPFTNKNGKLSISDKGIQITGHSYKTNALSDYISELKKLDWVDKVELINFDKDPTKEYAVFNIEVWRKHEG